MVWEQEVIVIAMVTLEREGGKVNKNYVSVHFEKSVVIIPGKTGMSPMCIILNLCYSKLVTIRVRCFPLKNLQLWS